MEYGRWLMAAGAGRAAGPPPDWAAKFVALLGKGSGIPASDLPLQSILTLVQSNDPIIPAYLMPVALSMKTTHDGDWVLQPARVTDGATAQARSELYEEFLRQAGAEPGFSRFFHLMRKYASTLPNTYGEPGVSLFEQWKIIAALLTISGSTQQVPTSLGLAGGDIPGIQRVINTVTAKGAAKAMRGRSAFIQLLGHALVDRLLDALELDLANVVYDAGGNFVLLTGWQEGEDGVQARIQRVANAVNRVLLGGTGEGRERFDGFHGDLAVAVAAVPLAVPLAAPLAVPLVEGATALQWDLAPLRSKDGASASRWQVAEKRLKDAVAAAKDRPFGDLAQADGEGWQLLFGREDSETDEFCKVCRRQRMLKEPEFNRLADDDEAAVACPECHGFIDLADDLGHSAAYLQLSYQAPDKVAAWQRALHEISREWWSVSKSAASGRVSLALDPDGFTGEGVSGFRWFAATTPMSADGSIKPSDEIAQASQGGLKRLGILRMDVDNLGSVMVQGLPSCTPMQKSELSQALERFFAGWLDRICARVDRGEKLFYVLFAGGDDLLVIGPWSLMPDLAVAIRDEFAQYCGGHPGLHLSAGIAVVGEHAPLYQAAEESDEALANAKQLDRDTPQAKNAITFLGRTYHWDDFVAAKALMDDIVVLAEEEGLGNAVITRLLAIERRYQRDRQGRRYGAKGATPPDQPEGVYYGPWMWRQAYALARLQEAYPHAAGYLKRLEHELLDGKILHLGLAARWAQWLTRKGA
jgi:CRISPR-associated protein Csm1